MELNESIEKLEKAYNGNLVKESVIDVLESLNVTSSAESLDGYPANHYISKEDLNKQMKTVADNIDKISGETKENSNAEDKKTDGIITKLTKILKTRENIKSAIEQRGVSVSSDTSFSDYGDKISEISDKYDLVDITVDDNVTFTAVDKGVSGFSSVTVDFSDKMIDLDVTSNGTYSSESEGVVGFRSVNVNIGSGSGVNGPFTVRFMDTDGQNILRVVANVPYGGGADYNGPTPTKEGYKFIGWKPSNYGITSDTICFPSFDKAADMYSETVSDDWSDVLENPLSVPIGTIKLLKLQKAEDLSIIYDYPGFSGGYCYMEKVYEGEQGTGSTWLCKDFPQMYHLKSEESSWLFGRYPSWMPLSPGYAFSPFYDSAIESSMHYLQSDYKYGWYETKFDGVGYPSYPIYLRTLLNGKFFKQCIPKEIRDAIKPVKKYSFCLGMKVYTKVYDLEERRYIDDNSYTWTPYWETTIDKIWIPSAGELYNHSLDSEMSAIIPVSANEVNYSYRASSLENRKMWVHPNYEKLWEDYPKRKKEFQVFPITRSMAHDQAGTSLKTLQFVGFDRDGKFVKVSGTDGFAGKQRTTYFGFCI